MKRGILVVSFGTTYKETREKNIDKLVETVRETFPDWKVYQAYSSNRIRTILRKRDSMMIPDTREALYRMKEEGITHAAILPTYIIDGIEYNKTKQIIEDCRNLFDEIKAAGVLLGDRADCADSAEALWQEIGEMAGDTPVILMGHGSAHEADASYAVLENELQSCSGKEIYIATVEGSKAIETVIDRLKASAGERGRVLLIPFMLTAGDHVVNDMAGEEDSFVSKLRAEGYEPECILKGIGEYGSIRSIYMNHLRKAVNQNI